MKMENLIGKKVYLKLKEETIVDFKVWDIKDPIILVTVSGIEYTLGIWIRNPGFKVKFLQNKKGKVIPKSKQKVEEVEADVFIRWEYIKGILDIKDDRLKIIKDKEDSIGFEKV